MFPSLYSDFFKVRTAEKGKPLIVVRLPLHLLRGKFRKKMKNKGEKGGETEERPKIGRKKYCCPPPPNCRHVLLLFLGSCLLHLQKKNSSLETLRQRFHSATQHVAGEEEFDETTREFFSFRTDSTFSPLMISSLSLSLHHLKIFTTYSKREKGEGGMELLFCEQPQGESRR